LVAGVFQVVRLENPVPEAISEIFQTLEPARTLFPHYEPFPLLDLEEYDRDWRGWPYRRPLEIFEAIIWQPRLAPRTGVSVSRIDAAIEERIEAGEFVPAAEWNGFLILARAKAVAD
jgi:hypothetical protein